MAHDSSTAFSPTGPVLILSTRFDVATDAVVAQLAMIGTDVVRVNTEDFPFETQISIDLPDGAVDGEFSLHDIRTNGAFRPSSVWLRRLRLPPLLDGMEQGAYEFAAREARSALLGLGFVSGAPTMNPTAEGWAAENKVYQLSVARDVGLDVPPTVITNSPDRVRRAFSDYQGQMVVKAVRSGYAELDRGPVAVYTRQVLDEHLASIESVRLAPSIYQPLLKKRTDVRVTIVGNRLWAAEIHSQSDPHAAIDWRRTERPDLLHTALALPEGVCRGLMVLMKRLGLVFGAIDLVRTPENRFVFLEVNPSGQWLWLESSLEFPISRSIAEWLTQPGMAGVDR